LRNETKDEGKMKIYKLMDPKMRGMKIGNWRLYGWELEYVLMYRISVQLQFLRAIAISLGSMSIPTIGLGLKSRTYTKRDIDMPSVASNIQDIFVFKPFTPKRSNANAMLRN
jgi:hypothetical protein